MKSASSQLLEQIRNGSAPSALPEVTVDWNLNRYHDTRVDNTPNEQDAGFDIELFPIESIVEPNRPGKGINKARVNQSVVSGNYLASIKGPTSRYYVADPDDDYKYWTSPKPAVNGVIPTFTDVNFLPDDYDLTGYDSQTSARPAVEYGTWSANKKTFTPKTVQANKIVIKLENSWASPNDFDVVITRPTDSPVTINSTNITGWEASGEIVLRWDGTSWVSGGTLLTGPNEFPVTDGIRKIQLVVRTMKGGFQRDGSPTKYLGPFGYTNTTDGKDGFLDVIAIEAHLEADLTPWLIEVDDTFEMADSSNLYPIGTITSNQGSMSLSNIYTDSQGEVRSGLFSKENTSIIWHDYMEPNAEVRLDYVYRSDAGSVIGRVKQFVMYTEMWAGQAGDTVSVDLSDYAKFFNDITVPAAMWEDLTVPQIVWRVLDSIGFSNYEIDRGERATEHTIPIFYTNGEDSVLTVLDDLAKASQSAIYFDSRGVLQIKTRDFALSATDAPVWTFQSNDTQSQLSNIVSLDQGIEFEPNSFKVVYQKTNWSDFNKGQPSMQQVWEPENDSVVLRGTPLVRNLGMDDVFVWIDPKEAKLWPFEGIVNIQGELIRFNGKQMVYFVGPNKQTDRRTITVRSADEVKDVNSKKAGEGQAKHSHFTGGMRIAVDDNGDRERGVWNSEHRTHAVNASGYSVRHRVNNTPRTDVPGFKHLKGKSKVQMSSGARFKDYKDILIATRGTVNDLAFFHYGTRLKFVKEQGRTTQCAGIVIHNSGTTEDGYYFELTSQDLAGKRRKGRGELIVYSRIDGVDKRLGRADVAIAPNIEYDFDITFMNVPNSTSHRLQAWVNGKRCVTVDVAGSNRNAANGKFGLFTRGLTKAEFEYLYAVRREVNTTPDDFSFLDKVRRGYMGARWDREWVFRWTSVRRRTKKGWRRAKRRFNRQFFDDFGPIVHEVREFDVKFEPSPVLHSRLYMTNDWSAINIEYNATPFGAKFAIANTARHNVVIHGEDTLSYAGDGQSVNQVLTVLGRGLVVAENEEVLAENTDQIRRRGKIESEISSPWIQSKSMANDLAAWLRSNFSYGNENLTLEVFGNPLVEVGDVVRIEYPEVHISGDYFVMSISNSFDEGLSTSLSVRKRI